MKSGQDFLTRPPFDGLSFARRYTA
jgi:hypothetical protein